MKLGLGLGVQQFPTTLVFDSDYQAVLNYAVSQSFSLPSIQQQELQNKLVRDLKDAGIWDNLDILYIFAVNGDSNFARINWKNPGTFTATLVNSPTFTSNVGFTGDGSTSYIDTNFTPSTDGVNYQQNAASAVALMSSVTAGNQFFIGAWDSSSNRLSSRLPNATNFRYRVNQSGLKEFAFSSANGLWHVNRSGSGAGNSKAYFNGSLADTDGTNPSSGLPGASVFILAQSNSGTPSNYSSGTVRMISLGGNLENGAAALYTAINNYITSI